MISVISTAIDD